MPEESVMTGELLNPRWGQGCRHQDNGPREARPSRLAPSGSLCY